MPRSVEDILRDADQLAKRFENDELGEPREVNGASLREVRKSFEARAVAERRMADAVSVARAEGHPWSAIGSMMGTTGEAARQRFGKQRGPARGAS